MKKGGYKIIDFGGSTLSSTPVTKTGILTSLKDNYGKVVLLTGIVIGGDVMDDCFSTPISDGDDGFKLNAYDGYIAVTKVGAVTYTVVSSEELAEDVSDLQTDMTGTRQMIAPVESDTTASKNYAIGEQFILNGLLSKAKTSITQGDTFVLDTNYELADSLSEQINNIGMWGELIHVDGTTSASGVISVTKTKNYTGTPYILSNLSQSLETPYIATVYNVLANTVDIRIRKMDDNSALVTTAVDFYALLIGIPA